jgi:hypothetical protein
MGHERQLGGVYVRSTDEAAINFRPAGWYLSSNFSQQQAQRPFDSILRRLGRPACVSLTCHTWRLWLVCVEVRRYILFLSAYETALGVLWFRDLVRLRVWALLKFSKLTKPRSRPAAAFSWHAMSAVIPAWGQPLALGAEKSHKSRLWRVWVRQASGPQCRASLEAVESMIDRRYASSIDPG